MTHVFLFGTLCWPDLLDLVGGASCRAGEEAELPGYHVTWAKGNLFRQSTLKRAVRRGAFCCGDAMGKFWPVWITMKVALAISCTR